MIKRPKFDFTHFFHGKRLNCHISSNFSNCIVTLLTSSTQLNTSRENNEKLLPLLYKHSNPGCYGDSQKLPDQTYTRNIEIIKFYKINVYHRPLTQILVFV